MDVRAESYCAVVKIKREVFLILGGEFALARTAGGRPNDSPGRRHGATSYAAVDGYMSLPELFTWRSDYFVVP